jgi:hypothetical protein
VDRGACPAVHHLLRSGVMANSDVRTAFNALIDKLAEVRTNLGQRF